jgi:hypothetical protein
MENIWIAAEALGVSLQILSLTATLPVEKELRQILGVPEHLKIAYTIRLGDAVATGKGLRVRRDIEDFTHYNKYGSRGYLKTSLSFLALLFLFLSAFWAKTRGFRYSAFTVGTNF